MQWGRLKREKAGTLAAPKCLRIYPRHAMNLQTGQIIGRSKVAMIGGLELSHVRTKQNKCAESSSLRRRHKDVTSAISRSNSPTCAIAVGNLTRVVRIFIVICFELHHSSR